MSRDQRCDVHRCAEQAQKDDCEQLRNNADKETDVDRAETKTPEHRHHVAAAGKVEQPATLSKALVIEAEQDADAKNASYRQVQTMIEADYSVVPLWQDTLLVVTWNDIQGITVSPNFRLYYGLLSK